MAEKAVAASEIPQVLLDRQFAVEGKLLCNIANAGACSRLGGAQVVARHFNLAFRGHKEPAKHAESGGFPRAVGAEESENFSAPHFKRGVSDGHKIAELAGNAVGANDDGTLGGVIGRSVGDV